MPEIVADGNPFEIPERAASETYLRETNPGLGPFALSTLQDAGTAFLGRAAERGTMAGSSAFDQGLAAFTAQSGVPEQPLVPTPEPVPSPNLPADQANELYAPRDVDGKIVPITDKPIPEALAKIIGRQKAEAMERESVLSRFAATHWGPTTFVAGALASMLDPLNAGSLFIPGIGESAIAARLGGWLLARTGARVVAGAEMGAAQQLPLSALKYGLAPEEASDYGLREAMRDLAYGAAGVAILHTGIGSVGEILGRGARTAAEPAGEREAVSAPGVAATVEQPRPAPADAAAILSADAATKNAAMRSAVGEIADGRPVDVGPIIATSEVVSLQPHEMTPRQLIERARLSEDTSIAEQERNGWAPGMSADELAEANGAVYGPKAEPEAAPRPGAAGADAELAAAEERAAQIPPESLHPEDQAALDASAKGVEKAGFFQKAFEAAAACLAGLA